MILDIFEYKTNTWINGLVGYAGPAYYIEIREDRNDQLRFYEGECGGYKTLKRTSKKEIQKLFDEGILPIGILKYL